MGGQSLLRETASFWYVHVGVTVGGVPVKYEHGSRPSTWTESDPGERLVVYWWYRELIETGGHYIERSSSVKPETRLSLHARRPQQRTPPSIDRAAKRTWFNEVRAPHPIHRGPSPRLFIFYYFCCIELDCNRLFWVSVLSTRVAFGILGSLPI